MAATVHKLIIIGSGPAGLTAGIYSARANMQPLIIDGKQPGGQLMGTTAVENWPGNTSIQGPALMINMQQHAQAMGCTFLSGEIVAVNFKQKPFTLTTNKQQTLSAHCIIIATGATPKRLNCPGEEQYWGKGVSTCAVCDGAFYRDKTVIIVGGGDTAMETASFMTNFTNNITIVHIHDKLTASAAMQERVINNPKTKIIYNSTVTAIKGDGNRITSVIIQNKNTQQEQELQTNVLFVTIGLTPNTEIFKEQIDLEKGGYIKVTNHTHTSVPGVFAAGDAVDFRYRQAITSAGTGCMAALDAERYLKH